MGDWYKGPNIKELAENWAGNQVVEYAMGAAVNGHGVKIAHELGVGVNVHPNVTEGYAKDGKLEWLKSQVKFVLAENSVEFGSIHQPEREVLGNPLATVRYETQKHGLSGFLLAMDHLFGLDKISDPQEILSRTIQVAKVLEDPAIREHTEAMHLALPGHEYIDPKDDNLDYLLRRMAQAPFKHPVRVALDFRSKEFSSMKILGQADYLRRFRDKVFNTVEQNN